MRTTLLLLAALLGLLVAGCVERVPEGGGSAPPGGQMINNPTPQPSSGGGVELNLFTWTEVDELNVNQELIKEFEKQNPGISVKITNVSGSKDAMQKLTTMFAAKTGPDVMSLHGAYYVGFADAGALMDLQPKIDADPEIV